MWYGKVSLVRKRCFFVLSGGFYGCDSFTKDVCFYCKRFGWERKAFESVFMCDVELLTVNKGAKGISIIFGVAEENFKKFSKSLFVNLIR